MSYQVTFGAGEHIQRSTERLMEWGMYSTGLQVMTRRERRELARHGSRGRRRARKLWEPGMLSGEVWGTFNDIRLVYRLGAAAEDYVNEFHAAHEARAMAYRESAEGKAAKWAVERRRDAMQLVADQLMEARESILAVGDLQMTIDYLCNLQKATDHIGVSIDRAALLQSFREAGFEPGVFCGDAFEPTREIFARWLIGQALDGIKQTGTPHPIIHKFADQWRDMFGAKLPAETT